MDELENTDDVAFLRGFEGTPTGFWTLPEIVHWIAFGEQPALTGAERVAEIEEAKMELRQACADKSFSLLGAYADHHAATMIPEAVYADPIRFSLSHNSIEADENSPQPFVVNYRPWVRVRALEKAVRARWPMQLLPQSAPCDDIIEVVRAGEPGRPSPQPIIDAEFERRIAAKLVVKGVANEAKALAKWIEKEHPNIAATKPDTIEKNISARYRQVPKSDKK